jgi:hypothetical protein
MIRGGNGTHRRWVVVAVQNPVELLETLKQALSPLTAGGHAA